MQLLKQEAKAVVVGFQDFKAVAFLIFLKTYLVSSLVEEVEVKDKILIIEELILSIVYN
jgi:hypothetical protein